jgi:RNA polymerase sigma-70 factor (ECF subfamily)
LTQDFFVAVLKGQLLQRANPARGRFRSLVLKALKDFVRDAEAKYHTRKRGGDVQFVSWDDWTSDAASHCSVSQEQASRWPAERIFDVRWAATVVECALRRLSEECAKRGRRRVFDVLSPCLAAERDNVSYSKLSKTLGIPKASVKRLVHQLRLRYRALLREEVGRTIEKADEIDDELRYLCAALTASE